MAFACAIPTMMQHNRLKHPTDWRKLPVAFHIARVVWRLTPLDPNTTESGLANAHIQMTFETWRPQGFGR